MSGQDGSQATPLQLPTNNNPEAWKAYWKAQNQPWRTEPEIDAERQHYLTERRTIKPDWKQGIFPLKDIKLNRADIEWLLATQESSGMRGAVDWKDESQREREGLNLRGANLRQANLSSLPLARIRGGLENVEWMIATEEQRNVAAVQLQEADLRGAQLQEATLSEAQLQEAYLVQAQLQKADLGGAQLQGANLGGAQLQEANLWNVQLQKADLRNVQLQKATLSEAQLQEANLWKAQLQKADLGGAQLQKADLRDAQLQGADLRRSDLDGAILKGVKLSDETYGSVRLADVRWGEVNLAVVDWGHVIRLGDEQKAHQKKDSESNIDEYKEAVRANRQLAIVLREQGLNEEADHFAYRAQVLQRVVLRWQKQYGRWLFSVFLAALTGYGYRLWRIFIAYGFIVSLCAVAYYVLGLSYPPHLSLLQAFLESITAFHGRVFSELFNSNTPQIWVTAVEAIAGLVIEGVFIAMLTQRFFGK